MSSTSRSEVLPANLLHSVGEVVRHHLESDRAMKQVARSSASPWSLVCQGEKRL